MEEGRRRIFDALGIRRTVLSRESNDATQGSSHPVPSIVADSTVLAEYATNYFGFRVDIIGKRPSIKQLPQIAMYGTP